MMLYRGVVAWLFAGTILIVSVGTGWAQDVGLTGTWYGPDGMTLSVRQVGQDVWWVARSKDGGKGFTSVFYGKLTGNHLLGHFADLPEGKNQSHGSLKAKLVLKDRKAVMIEGELLFANDDTPRPWSISRTKPEK